MSYSTRDFNDPLGRRRAAHDLELWDRCRDLLWIRDEAVIGVLAGALLCVFALLAFLDLSGGW